jgi:hypothetical protein
MELLLCILSPPAFLFVATVVSRLFIILICIWQTDFKSSIFWDITPCSPLKVKWRFGRTLCLRLQDRRISRARNQRESRWQADEMLTPKRRLTFNGLHGIISQKTDVFILTAVRISNPKKWFSLRTTNLGRFVVCGTVGVAIATIIIIIMIRTHTK